MTEDENKLLINGHGPIMIDPKDYPSKHAIVIGKCGTSEHKRIIREMIKEDAQKRSEEILND